MLRTWEAGDPIKIEVEKVRTSGIIIMPPFLGRVIDWKKT